MSNVTVAQQNIPALSMNEGELINVLRNSLYPGAQDESIKLVIGYCRASGLDPMQKPVHLVPMYDAKAKQMRDVVMPGIGLYRTQASRSGQYAGVSEPEFGDEVTKTFPDEPYYDNYSKSNKTRPAVTVTYPKWCRVTVRRMMPNGTVVEFSARELWMENYATSGRDSEQPNAMWKRRPFAQLAKCAEAQALRKAFPEFGAQPTADEMEGREIYAGDAEIAGQQEPQKPAAPQRKSQAAPKATEPQREAATIDGETGEVIEPQQKPQKDAPAEQQQKPAAGNAGNGQAPAAGLLTVVRKKLEIANLTEAEALAAFNIESLEASSTAVCNQIIKWAQENAKA